MLFFVFQVVFCKDVHFALEELSKSGYDVIGLDWTIQPLHGRSVTHNAFRLQMYLTVCMAWLDCSKVT